MNISVITAIPTIYPNFNPVISTNMIPLFITTVSWSVTLSFIVALRLPDHTQIML